MLVASLGWIGGTLGWTTLGTAAVAICVLLVLLGYAVDLEAATLRRRLQEKESDLRKVRRAHKRQTSKRWLAERNAAHWRRLCQSCDGDDLEISGRMN